ncbi:CBS domain-containing protein [bacterium]|nr:CBS domain-containing protein [bacterium]
MTAKTALGAGRGDNVIKTASDIMTRSVICAGPQETVNSLINTFLDHRISCAPVVDESGSLVGIVTKTDILAHIVHLDLDLTLKVALKDVLGARADSSGIEVSSVSDLKVSDIMTRQAITAEESTPVKNLAEMMIEHGIHRIVITRDGAISGILSTLDLLYFIAEKEKHG